MIEVKPQIFWDVCKPRSNLKPGAPVGGRRITRGHRRSAGRKKNLSFHALPNFRQKTNIKEGHMHFLSGIIYDIPIREFCLRFELS